MLRSGPLLYPPLELPPRCGAPGCPPSCPLVGPRSRLASPGERLSCSAVGSLIIGSPTHCFASAPPGNLLVCAYTDVSPVSKKAAAIAIIMRFIVDLRLAPKLNSPRGLRFLKHQVA